jgi:hypothetical protein
MPDLPDFKKITQTANDMTLSVMDKQKKLKEVLDQAMESMIPGDDQEYCHGMYKNLSYDAMMAQMELDYPRIQVDGKS